LFRVQPRVEVQYLVSTPLATFYVTVTRNPVPVRHESHDVAAVVRVGRVLNFQSSSAHQMQLKGKRLQLALRRLSRLWLNTVPVEDELAGHLEMKAIGGNSRPECVNAELSGVRQLMKDIANTHVWTRSASEHVVAIALNPRVEHQRWMP